MSDIIRKPKGAPGSTGGQFDGRTRTAAGGTLSLEGIDSEEELLAAYRSKIAEQTKADAEKAASKRRSFINFEKIELSHYGHLMDDPDLAKDLEQFEQHFELRKHYADRYTAEHANLGKKIGAKLLVKAGYKPVQIEYARTELDVRTEDGKWISVNSSKEITGYPVLDGAICRMFNPWHNNKNDDLPRGEATSRL